MDDERLIISECLEGNAGRFDVLIIRYQSAIFALGMNILGDPDEAMDVCQDTFAQAYINLHRFDMERKFKNWLLGIAVKRSLDRIRKKKSFLAFFDRYAREGKTSDHFKTHGIEESVVFRQFLKQLNPRERTALSLKMNEGYTAKEIAEVLRCSENTAYVHLFKAKQKIKKAYTAAGKMENTEVKP